MGVCSSLLKILFIIFCIFIISCSPNLDKKTIINKTSNYTPINTNITSYINSKKPTHVYMHPSKKSKLLIKLPYSCEFKIIGKSFDKGNKWLKIKYGTYIIKKGWILNPEYLQHQSLNFKNVRFVNSLDGLNLRKAPSTKSKIIKPLPYLTCLYFLRKINKKMFDKYGWLKAAVFKNGRISNQGWVADLFLQKKFYPNVIYLNEKTKGIRWIYSSNGLNLRNKPDTKSKIVKALHFKERIEPIALTKTINIINGKKGRWLYCKYINYVNNTIKFGWVFNPFVISAKSFFKKRNMKYGTYYLKQLPDTDYNHVYKKAYIKLFRNGKYFYFIEGLNGEKTKYAGKFSLASDDLLFDNLGIKFMFVEKNGDIFLSDMKSINKGNVYVKVN